MYRLEKDITFESAHVLPFHQGKCGHLHGHNYRLTIVCESEVLQPAGTRNRQVGMIMDTDDIYRAWLKIMPQYDHVYLNESLGMEHTTVEALAKRIYDDLKSRISMLVEIRLCETDRDRASYRP